MEAYEPDEVDVDVVDDLSDDDDNDAEKEQDSSSSSSSRPIGVGDVVEVLGGDRPYAGVVIGMIDETTCRLKYFEFEAEVSLPLDSLTRLIFTGPSSVTIPDDIQLNTKGIYQCKYATDQQYYDAIVTAITTHGAQVTYNAYGNSEEVPLAYLKTMEKTKSKKGSTPLDKSLVPLAIPENLKILPTDTEEEKMKKKKKLKAIKSKNRLITKEAEIVAVQHTWQKFLAKKKPLAVKAAQKTSMFASSDAVDAKVGVIGSGKGITKIEYERKKHKF